MKEYLEAYQGMVANATAIKKLEKMKIKKKDKIDTYPSLKKEAKNFPKLPTT